MQQWTLIPCIFILLLNEHFLQMLFDYFTYIVKYDIFVFNLLFWKIVFICLHNRLFQYFLFHRFIYYLHSIYETHYFFLYPISSVIMKNFHYSINCTKFALYSQLKIYQPNIFYKVYTYQIIVVMCKAHYFYI